VLHARGKRRPGPNVLVWAGKLRGLRLAGWLVSALGFIFELQFKYKPHTKNQLKIK
jgi:hypothetical protein